MLKIRKLTILQNDGCSYHLSDGLYIAIDVMHRNCDFQNKSIIYILIFCVCLGFPLSFYQLNH